VSNREAADGETDEEGLKAIYALHAVFLAHRGFDMPPKAAKKHRTGLVGVGVDDDEDEVASASAPNAKTKYRHWIHEQYLDYVAVLLDVLSTNEPELYAVPCLKILMDLLANSAAVPVPKWKFPSSLLQRILTAIVAGEAEKPELFECFLGGYVQFDDVRRHTYKVLASICTQAAASSSPDDQRTLAYNVYNILQSFEGCSPPAEEGKPALFAAPSEGDLAPTHALGKAATYKRSYSQCWLAFLKLQLPSEIFKNVLLRMCEDIMPYMYDPKLLIDFLRDSYVTPPLPSRCLSVFFFW
jgi:U3 small nucleolar RNA-associated protein 19